jgi:hypothetical protein
MKQHAASRKRAQRRLVTISFAVLTAFAGIVGLAYARTTNAISITVENNSQREIRHLYLAQGSPDNWGPDQLGGATIATNGSFALNNVSCDGSSVRVIAEDQNGCFYYNNVSCSGSGTWTITDSAVPDCGN